MEPGREGTSRSETDFPAHQPNEPPNVSQTRRIRKEESEKDGQVEMETLFSEKCNKEEDEVANT